MMSMSPSSAGHPAAEVEMSRRRWWPWLGPPVAVLVIGLLLTRFQPGAEAGGKRTAPPAGACVARPLPTDGAGQVQQGSGVGTWWRIEDRLDQSGSLIGRQVAVGHDGARGLSLDLDVESSASGPVSGIVVVVSDTGRKSTIRLVSAVEGCSWLVDESQNVVRGAILDPTDGTVLAHVIERATRADLGTWRFGAAGALTKPALVADPLLSVDGGAVWTTDLRLDAGGTTLAVQSCGETTCVTRLFDLASGALSATVKGDQGALIGLVGDRLVTWSACRNLPCSIVAWNIARGGHQQLVEAARAGALSADGRWLVATLDADTGRTLRYDLATDNQWLIRGISTGEQVLDIGAAATSGIQVPPDEVGITSDGAIPHPFRPAAAEVIP
jgi:hypothetical protein